MTDKELIKIFERLCKVDTNSTGAQCLNAQAVRKLIILSKATLDLINRQKKRIHWLEIELKAMRGAANSYKAENERLKKSRDRWRQIAEDFDKITRENEKAGEG